ncbi:AAA family ATPase [uncultured Streptomyces sp.]|uniref:ATP-binding protein n=1 Tax=uncultured Streptomyces sp. TaxID=174707 RepID=UPI00262C3934|nr:AAA family ATPase [uncultured Streptomyces sp.]
MKPSRPLYEREPEIQAATEALNALCGAQAIGGLLVFSGEGGIGKTALLAEIQTMAADRCTVWSARGGETVTSVPFHVVRQLLQPALDELSLDDRLELFGDWYEITAPALGLAQPSGPQPDPQGVRDGLDHVVRGLATRLSHRPLLLVVDDAHWADGESLAWLSRFTAHLHELPVLVVQAQRPKELADRGDDWVADWSPAAGGPESKSRLVRVALRALTPDATAELVRAALGEHADDPFCREVWAVTGGNPYEAVELVAKVQDNQLPPVEESAGELRELGASARGSGLVARLERLGTNANRFAWAAAVLGTEISQELAASLAGMTPAEAADCTARLRDARIVTGFDPLEFVHPLIASAIYRSIPSATRTAFHGRAAWAITEAGMGAAAASRHLLEVHPEADQDVVRQLREAARQHLAVGAPEAARRCLERALREPPRPEDHAPVLYELGCATLLSSPPTTVRHLRTALEMPGLDDALRVDATFRLAAALAHNNELREAAATLASEAARTAPGPGLMRLQAAHFQWEGMQAEEVDAPGRSRRLANNTRHLAGRDNAERALLTIRAFDAMMRGENAAMIVDYCERALVNGSPARGLGWTDAEWGFEFPTMVGITYAFTDQLDRAESLFSEAVRAFEISGWSGAHLAFAHTLMGLVHRRRGKLAEAEGFLREGLRLADRVGTGLAVQWDAACLLIDTLLARGRTAEARLVADRYKFGAPWPSAMVLPDGPCVHGRLLLAEGRTKEAIAELESIGAALEARERFNGVWAPWAGDLARALRDEDPVRAAELANRARQHAERFGTDTAIGEALRCLALFAPEEEAHRLLADAVRHLTASDSQYELALARYDYGVATRDRRELAQAQKLAVRCGAEELVERAQRAGASIRSSE